MLNQLNVWICVVFIPLPSSLHSVSDIFQFATLVNNDHLFAACYENGVLNVSVCHRVRACASSTYTCGGKAMCCTCAHSCNIHLSR